MTSYAYERLHPSKLHYTYVEQQCRASLGETEDFSMLVMIISFFLNPFIELIIKKLT